MDKVNVESDGLYSLMDDLIGRMKLYALIVVQTNFYTFWCACSTVKHGLIFFAIGLFAINTFTFGWSYPIWTRSVQMMHMV